MNEDERALAQPKASTTHTQASSLLLHFLRNDWSYSESEEEREEEEEEFQELEEDEEVEEDNILLRKSHMLFARRS